ncbi:MAG: hypothetical protein AAF372_03740 [Pseudomonadota bacterium]
MEEQQFFKNFMLGVTEGEVLLETRAMNIAAIHKFATSAVNYLKIISRTLDHQVYDQLNIIDALSEFARRNRHSCVEILVYDCTEIVRSGHRLIHLAEKMSSKINIRKLPAHMSQFNESLVIADNNGYIHNPQSDRYEGIASFNDPTRCTELNKIFSDMWNHGEVEPYLRSVSR